MLGSWLYLDLTEAATHDLFEGVPNYQLGNMLLYCILRQISTRAKAYKSCILQLLDRKTHFLAFVILLIVYMH